MAGEDFAAYLQHLPVGLYRTTPRGEFLYANDELARMLGFDSTAALLAINARDLYFDPADRERWQSMIAERGQVTHFDVRKRRADGTPIWLRDNGRAVQDASGEVVAYEGAVIDVSAQHHAEGELRVSEARYRALVEAIPDAIFRLGPEGSCLDARLGSLFRLFPPASRCVGAPLEEIFDADLAAACRAAAERCGDGGPVTLEHAASGARGDVYLDVCVSATEGGGTLVLLRDATAARRFRDWMVRSERLASVGSLATGAAHEINNPLTAVVANTDLARDLAASCRKDAESLGDAGQRLSARLGELLRLLDDAAQGAAGIADAVRALRSIAGPADDVPTSVVLEATLETALRVVKNHIRHRAELAREIFRLPPVWGNATRLEDVFVSLLVNAAESIEPGRANENLIRVRAEESGDGRVQVEISDTGAGIAPADVERIFDPFYTTKPAGAGTGLGLSVCRAIVSSYGGEIEVDSSPGVGTTFRVMLLSAKSAPAPRPTIPAQRPRISRGRVAIVDDEAMVGGALERMLSGEHELFVTQSAQALLDALASGERFDAILCDVMMPVLTGVGFHREVAERFPEQAPSIVFISGGVFTDEMRRYLAAIPNVTLDKPLSAGKLVRAVAEQVARSQAARGRFQGPPRESGPAAGA